MKFKKQFGVFVELLTSYDLVVFVFDG